MNKIINAFKEKKIFIPFLTAGYPDYDKFVDIVKMFDKIGAGVVEIGIPFSDPLADGRIIQNSSQAVLDKGINIDIILDLVKKIRQDCSVPIVFMTYYNLVLNRGIEKFVNDAVDAGVDGIIVPDLPPEEAEDLLKQAENKLAVTFLVSTISRQDRIKYIADKTTGFIYYIARLGVTGEGVTELDVLKQKVEDLKNIIDKPVGIGFGVSGKDDAQAIYEFADGVIVGSAIIDFINKNIDDNDLIEKLEEYCRQFIIS
jgi:tryptophan synthase alpha chain